MNSLWERTTWFSLWKNHKQSTQYKNLDLLFNILELLEVISIRIFEMIRLGQVFFWGGHSVLFKCVACWKISAVSQIVNTCCRRCRHIITLSISCKRVAFLRETKGQGHSSPWHPRVGVKLAILTQQWIQPRLLCSLCSLRDGITTFNNIWSVWLQ